MTKSIDALAKSMLDAVTVKKSSTEAAEAILQKSQLEKVSSIKESIDDIYSQIEDRKALSTESAKAIDKIIYDVDKVLAEINSYGNGIVEYTDIRKEMLKKKFDLVQAKADEKLNLWKDISTLKKELREHLKELRDLESKGSMLDDLMGL